MKRFSIFLLSVISSVLSAQVTITNAFAIPGFRINKLVTDVQGMIYVLQGYLYGPNGYTVKQKLEVRKYTPGGQLVWQRTMTGNDLFLVDASMKSDQLIFAGGFSDTLQYAGQQIISAGQHDIYLARIRSDGFMDIKRQGGTGDERILGFTVDDNQDLYFSGSWSGQVNFAGYDATLNNKQHFIACTDPLMGQTNWIRTGVSVIVYPNVYINGLRVFNQELYGRCYQQVLLYPSDTIGINYSRIDGFIMSTINGQKLKVHNGEWNHYRGGGHYIEDVDSNGNLYWHEVGTMGCCDRISCTSGGSVKWKFSPVGWASFVLQSDQMHVATGYSGMYGYFDTIIQVGTIGPPTSTIASLTGTIEISGPYRWMRLGSYRLGETIAYGHFSKRLHFPGTDLISDSTDIPFIAMINWNGTVGSKENDVSELKIYPNPTCGNLNIECKASVQVIFYDIIGERVYQTTANAGQNNIDISRLPAGLYLAQFGEGNSRVSKRIVRE